MEQEFFDKGLEKAKQKDYAGAIEEFTKALQGNSEFVEAYYQRGLAYYDLGHVAQAVFDYDRVLKRDSYNVEAYYCRALARLALKNLPGALKDVNKVIEINSCKPGAYNLRGVIERKLGNIENAIANFKQAANLYLEQKDTENAKRCLEKVKQLQPRKQEVVLEKPQLQNTPLITEKDYFTSLLEKAEKGSTREAMEDLNWVLRADAQDGKAYCCRGVVYCKEGKYQQAIADFNTALQLNFHDAVVYRNRGKARLQMGDNQGAIADFNQALKIEPEDDLIYVARGNAYQAIGHYLGAIEDYNTALQMNPTSASAFYNRGLCNVRMEEIPQAINDFQQAASIYCEQEDWDNYKVVSQSLKKLSTPSAEVNEKNNYERLRYRLLRLVGGQWEIAQRLIEQARYYYPGMSEEWYIETVIHDLERDKGR
ncbi:tetratricopeptide repeat protein [Rivularia sp. PCC 7116]|uniref:tetratricopeptide repeat protein n=1 Tax=Rivularia sp. PCC 7116 TaxID=373994 RepID=UPI00029F43A2|nr:tetratricopeptide repeat protein [Rivularia sp. PCC 7116]AFY56863.1 tetratricopeptide repeat protein [Rivularia sp. PCC 7116]